MNVKRIAAAVVAALAGLAAHAADIVLTPPASGGVSITTSAGSTALRVDPEGGVVINGNLVLAPTNSPAAGSIMRGAVPWMHAFGAGNVFLGLNSGNFTLFGTFNTAVGSTTLYSNTGGNDNTAIGASALFFNTTGSRNTAVGSEALFSNTAGVSNTAIGQGALYASTTATGNTATGASALHNSTTAADNTANGYLALRDNTTGHSNTASGRGAMLANTAGIENTAHGTNALHDSTSGNRNTAIGNDALFNNTTGFANVAVGSSALAGNVTGNSNIAIGAGAGINTIGTSNIVIGHGGATEDYTIRIGGANHDRTFITGIRGKTTGNANAVAVMIDNLGQLGTVSSSARFKDDIADMDDATTDLMKLRPVTFHYKADQDPSGRTLQYGLVAEEVAQVYPGLVAHSPDGKMETVMYQFLPPMLLNEFQKQQREIAGLRAELAAIRQQLGRQP